MAYTPEKYREIAQFKPAERVLAEAMFEHLKIVNVFRDHYPVLAARGELKDKLTYVSSFDSDQDLIIAIDDRATQYTRSMDDVWHSRDDFRAGWRAFEKIVKAREEAEEIAREAKEAAKPKFVLHDTKRDEYAIIENDYFKRTVYASYNATVWKTKAAATKAKQRHCNNDQWRVVNINEKK